MKNGTAVVMDFIKSNILDRLSGEMLAFGQGVYLVIGGLWPLFSMGSFLAVTGPKTDLWLVKTTGLLLAVIGAVLIFSALRKQVSWEMFLLAAGSAASLAGIELFYVSIGRISAIYLADASLELLLVMFWAYVFFGEKRNREAEKSMDVGNDT